VRVPRRLVRRREVVVLVPCTVYLAEADLRTVVQELGVAHPLGQLRQVEVFQHADQQRRVPVVVIVAVVPP
jgi:hypothetical protein